MLALLGLYQGCRGCCCSGETVSQSGISQYVLCILRNQVKICHLSSIFYETSNWANSNRAEPGKHPCIQGSFLRRNHCLQENILFLTVKQKKRKRLPSFPKQRNHLNTFTFKPFPLSFRHPSNLMLNRLSGKICHIDFGDCFEVCLCLILLFVMIWLVLALLLSNCSLVLMF